MGAKNDALDMSYWHKFEWLTGFALYLIGNLICFVGSAMAPQSLLSCLCVWQIVVVMGLGQYLLGERLTVNGLVGCTLLATGCLWSIFAGPKGITLHTADSLMQAFESRQMLCLFLLSVAVVSLPIVAAAISKPLYFHFVLLSACCAWYAELCSRSMAALLLTSFEASRAEYRTWLFWSFLAVFVAAAVLQIHFLNLSYKEGDAVVIMPTFLALSITGQIVTGSIFFGEMTQLDLAGHIHFWPGVCIVLLGALMLARRPREEEKSLKSALLASFAQPSRTSA